MKDQNFAGNMFDELAKAMQPDTRLFKLNAIWVENGLRVFNKYSDPKVKLTHRIAQGDILSLDGSSLADYNTGDNWEIVECTGTLDNSVLQVELRNTDTGIIKTITL